jgi:hypothetical protein
MKTHCTIDSLPDIGRLHGDLDPCGLLLVRRGGSPKQAVVVRAPCILLRNNNNNTTTACIDERRMLIDGNDEAAALSKLLPQQLLAEGGGDLAFSTLFLTVQSNGRPRRLSGTAIELDRPGHTDTGLSIHFVMTNHEERLDGQDWE